MSELQPPPVPVSKTFRVMWRDDEQIFDQCTGSHRDGDYLILMSAINGGEAIVNLRDVRYVVIEDD